MRLYQTATEFKPSSRNAANAGLPSDLSCVPDDRLCPPGRRTKYVTLRNRVKELNYQSSSEELFCLATVVLMRVRLIFRLCATRLADTSQRGGSLHP